MKEPGGDNVADLGVITLLGQPAIVIYLPAGFGQFASLNLIRGFASTASFC